MKQTRRHALLESIVNTLSGFVISNLAWPFISVYLLRMTYRPVQGLTVITTFTVLSIARNFLIRRAFDHHHHRGLLNDEQKETLREYQDRDRSQRKGKH